MITDHSDMTMIHGHISIFVMHDPDSWSSFYFSLNMTIIHGDNSDMTMIHGHISISVKHDPDSWS